MDNHTFQFQQFRFQWTSEIWESACFRADDLPGALEALADIFRQHGGFPIRLEVVLNWEHEYALSAHVGTAPHTPASETSYASSAPFAEVREWYTQHYKELLAMAPFALAEVQRRIDSVDTEIPF